MFCFTCINEDGWSELSGHADMRCGMVCKAMNTIVMYTCIYIHNRHVVTTATSTPPYKNVPLIKN